MLPNPRKTTPHRRYGSAPRFGRRGSGYRPGGSLLEGRPREGSGIGLMSRRRADRRLRCLRGVPVLYPTERRVHVRLPEERVELAAMLQFFLDHVPQDIPDGEPYLLGGSLRRERGTPSLGSGPIPRVDPGSRGPACRQHTSPNGAAPGSGHARRTRPPRLLGPEVRTRATSADRRAREGRCPEARGGMLRDPSAVPSPEGGARSRDTSSAPAR